MSHLEMKREVGQRVIANGFEGTIIEVCDWDNGLVVVTLPRGTVCVGFSTLQNPNDIDVLAARLL